MLFHCNNFYAWSSQLPLQIGEFRLLSEIEIAQFDVIFISDDAKKGYLVEVSLSNGDQLHNEHNCLPLAPIKRSILDEELSPYAKEAWMK